MKEYYSNNKEYLQDVIEYVELLKKSRLSVREMLSRRQEKESGDAAPQKPSAPEFLELMKKRVEKSLSMGIKLPLEQIISKNRLNSDEAKILMILVHAKLTYLEEYMSIRKILELLLGSPEEYVNYHEYFQASSKLFKNQILWYEYISKYNKDLNIRPEIFAKILNRKFPKENSGKIRKMQLFSSPMRLYEKINEYVVGQENAKKMLATAVYQHYKKVQLNEKRKGIDAIEKSNILFIGPTGVGKTHLCRTLAKIMNIPMAICDATQYTESGYVGLDVEEMLVGLRRNAKDNPKLAEKGIVYINEIDKIAARNPGGNHYGGHKDVSGASVQQELLKLLEGDEIHYQKRGPWASEADFKVKNVLFIASGAFAGLEDIVRERITIKKIGFGSEQSSSAAPVGSLLKYVTTEDLIQYGFMPEFIGRFPIIIVMDPLGKEEIIDIMLKPKNAIVSQYRDLFSACGLNFEFNSAELEKIADEVIHRGVGARGLRAIFENRYTPMMFEKLSQPAVVGEPREKQPASGRKTARESDAERREG